MLHDVDRLYKLRSVLVGVLILASLLLLVILAVGLGAKSLQAYSAESSGSVFSESSSPNAVLSGMSDAAYNLEQNTASTARAVNANLRTAADTTARTGRAVVRTVSNMGTFAVRAVVASTTFVAQTTGNSIAFLGNTASESIALVGSTTGNSAQFLASTASDSMAMLVRSPGKMIGVVAHVQGIDTLIKPVDDTPVPTIDPDSPAFVAAQKAMGASPQNKQAASQTKPQWPIHGEITTLFGVPHWPFQPVHTGIDISDGTAPGTTPIKPFKPGKVVEVVHSSTGLGNHVTIDHGSGVTSVYGHLSSISVRTGQKVTLKTLLGYEGSTGASTGTHLHFEIRIDGKVADPLKFINGRP